MGDAARITEFHAHVYFDGASRDAAAALREGLGARFVVALGRWHERPIGPHPKAMYQVAFAPDQFGALVPWMMLNRGALSVLVHPMTGDAVADHSAHALWLGERLAIDLEFLREHG